MIIGFDIYLLPLPQTLYVLDEYGTDKLIIERKINNQEKNNHEVEKGFEVFFAFFAGKFEKYQMNIGKDETGIDTEIVYKKTKVM